MNRTDEKRRENHGAFRFEEIIYEEKRGSKL